MTGRHKPMHVRDKQACKRAPRRTVSVGSHVSSHEPLPAAFALVFAQVRRAVFSSLKKKKYVLCEKRFSITSNLRYMHGILNVDEIKN
jgi:hypothetical protein